MNALNRGIRMYRRERDGLDQAAAVAVADGDAAAR
jgi:hypothetical protein